MKTDQLVLKADFPCHCAEIGLASRIELISIIPEAFYDPRCVQAQMLFILIINNYEYVDIYFN
jgi:hypothetical protein